MVVQPYSFKFDHLRVLVETGAALDVLLTDAGCTPNRRAWQEIPEMLPAMSHHAQQGKNVE
jgi:hypothetical protein